MSRWLPIPASSHAASIDREMAIVHIVMLLLLVGWSVYLAYVLWRFRRAKQPHPAATHARGRIALMVTGGVVVFETVILVGMALPTWTRQQTPPTITDGATVIRVVAQQFAWNFHYPGADGQFGDTREDLMTGENPVGLDRASAGGADDIVSPVMHVPLGRQIVLQLSSKDVIHSFGVPNFRIKQDVIPGMLATVWFTPTVEGRFDIACSQLCGLGHYRMRATIVVESADAYRQFLADEAAFLR